VSLRGAGAATRQVSGDAGDDLIDTYGDGQVDTVDCGPDTDTAYVDAIDSTSNCETVVGRLGGARRPGGQRSGLRRDDRRRHGVEPRHAAAVS
jgi:hypothetical protein